MCKNERVSFTHGHPNGSPGKPEPQKLQKLPLIIAGVLGLLMLAYTVTNGLRMSQKNPLYQNCRVVVKKGMTLEEVQKECGEPVFDTGGTSYRIMSFMESRLADEDMTIKFRNGRVSNIEFERM